MNGTQEKSFEELLPKISIQIFYKEPSQAIYLLSIYQFDSVEREEELPKIDEILDVLKNGKWHNLKEISEKTHLRGLKVELLTEFLAEYDFIELNKKEHKTRLAPPLFNFLRKIQDLEEREGLAVRLK